MGRRTHSDVLKAPNGVDELVAFDGYSPAFAQARVIFCPEALNDESQALTAKIVLRPAQIYCHTFDGERLVDPVVHFASVFRINESACHTSKAGKKPLRKCID